MRVQYEDTEDVIAESGKQAQTRRRAERVDSVLSEAWSRGKWLLGLLVLQSMSSIVLDSLSRLATRPPGDHPVSDDARRGGRQCWQPERDQGVCTWRCTRLRADNVVAHAADRAYA